MLMFEWILVLLLAAVILTNLAERLAVPYPSLLAIARRRSCFPAVRPASISAVSPLYEPENPLGHCYAMYVSGLTISGEHPNGSLGHSVATDAFELEHRATEAADDFC